MRVLMLGWLMLGLLMMSVVGCSSVPLEGWGAEKVKGNPEKKVTAKFSPGTELYTAELEGGVLKASVESVANNVRGRKIEVYVVLHNTTSREVRFELSNTLLEVDGAAISAKDLPPYWDVTPDVKGNSTRKKKWAFELVSPVPAGIYQLRISDLKFADGGAAGDDLLIEVKVPGRATDTAG